MAELPKPQNTTIQAIYNHYENNQESPHRAHLGASIIGRECERELYYTFHWCTATRHNGRLLRLFETGQLEEYRFVKNLRDAGVTVWDTDENTGEQFRVSFCGGHFGGSLDGVGKGFIEAPEKPHVIEMKTHSEKSFKDLVDKGVQQSKPEHYAQMQVYMGLMKIDRAYYLSRNKNNDELYGERVRYDEKALTALLDKAHRIITTDRPPARMNENPEFYKCKWCDHHSICHSEKSPEVNCRTCAHSTAVEDGFGTWECSFYKIDLSEETQRESAKCPSHIYNPHLLSWAEPIDSGENSITYQVKENGEKFKNGDDGYRSVEIHACATPTILSNDTLQLLRDKFNGEITG